MVKRLLKLLNIVKKDPRHYFFLGLILILFSITRLLYIDLVPPSLYWDEASIGYNAYSISETFRDEWGDFLPLHFRAFGEFKLPVYIYTTVAFVKTLGLTELAVRLPAVLYSFGILLVVYFLTQLLIKDNPVTGKRLSLLSVFYLVVSPWFFIFTRTGYEATAGLFFLVLGFLFYFLTEKKAYFWILSVVSYILAIYSYNSLRIVVPVLFVFNLVFLYKKKFSFKLLFFSTILFLLSYIPIVRLYFLDQGAVRYSTVSEGSIQGALENFFSHFAPTFLLNGDVNPRSTLPGFGVIWPYDLLIIPLGIFAILKAKYFKNFFLILIGLVLSLVPSAITKESPHALRSLSAVLFVSVIWSEGLEALSQKFKKFRILILSVFAILVLFSFETYYMNFLKVYPLTTSQEWQYSYKQIFRNYRAEIEKADKVIISDEYAQPYIFALFYQKNDPTKFIMEKKLSPVSNWGFSTVSSFSKFEFRKAKSEDFNKGNLLFITEKEAKEEAKRQTLRSKILNLDGSTSLLVYKL